MVQMEQADAPPLVSPVAVICGSGSLPYAVADAISAQGGRPILFPIRGFADPVAASRYPHDWIALGQFGRLCRLAAAAGCRHVVLIGGLVRPSLGQLRLDWPTLRLLPRLRRLYRGGDDQLLSGIGQIFEEHGLRLVGAHELAPEILMPEGVLGSRAPSEREQADVQTGFAFLDAISPFDVGQAVVVHEGRVLGVEAIEGTDALLARIAALRQEGRLQVPAAAGILVKAPKRGQSRRLDLPAIGAQTVAGAAAAQLSGIAVAAGSVLVAEAERVASSADRAGVFVIGARPPATRDHAVP